MVTLAVYGATSADMSGETDICIAEKDVYIGEIHTTRYTPALTIIAVVG